MAQAAVSLGHSNPPDAAALLSIIDALREENADLRLRLRQRLPEVDGRDGGAASNSESANPASRFHAHSSSSISETGVAQAKAKVRRNKHAIDAELGKEDVFTAPHVDSFRNLFNQSDLLQFEEDSPTFRLQVNELEEGVDELRVFAQQLVDSCRRYCKHGNHAVESGREFAGLLKSLTSDAWVQRFGRVASLLAKFGETFEEIESFREGLLRSLEETFCAPMEEFVRLEVKRVRNMKQEVQKASSDLEASLVKYLRHRHSGGSGPSLAAGSAGQDSSEKWEAQMAVLRQSFELTRYDMVVELNSQKANRKFQLCQRVCNSLYDHLGYFQECHAVVAAVQPTLAQLNAELALARKDFSRQGMLYNLKRKLLLREVKRSSPALALLLPKRKRGSFQSDVVSVPQKISLGLPILGLDLRRPSVESQQSAARRPSVESAAPASSAIKKLWGASVSSDPGTSPKPRVVWGENEVVEPDLEQRVSDTLNYEEIVDLALTAPVESRRPPLFGQVGELEGLRLSQYFGSRAESGEFDSHLSPEVGKSPGSVEHARHTWSRSTTSDRIPIPVNRQSSAGEIISAVSSPPGTPQGLVSPSASPERPPPEDVQRSRSVSVHSIYSDHSRRRGKSKIRIQGYLWKQSNNIARDWHRRWFFVEDGHLWYMQTEVSGNKPLISAGGIVGPTATSHDPAMHHKLMQAVERKLVCNLMISMVKEMSGPLEFKYCWQVISPGKRVYLLQAESVESYNTWVNALRTEIEISLSKVQTSDAHSSHVGSPGFLTTSQSVRELGCDDKDFGHTLESTIVLSEGQQEALKTVNRCCADCDKPDPDWASVNNGIMLCIECCGVHRSLGTHVSKVRSLRLDRWTPNSVHLLTIIGNRRFNNIFERTLRNDDDGDAANLVRPTAHCPTAERVAFIISKYMERKYVGSSLSQNEANTTLIQSAGEGNIVGMMEAIAAGAEINSRSLDEHLLSALHCACRGGHDMAVELLCQMNASLDITDALGKTPSDYVDNDNIAVIDTLYTNVENAAFLDEY